MSNEEFVVTPQMALVYAIAHAGPAGMMQSLESNIRAEHLGDEDDDAYKIYAAFQEFYERTKQLPSWTELTLSKRLTAPPPPPLKEGESPLFDLTARIAYMTQQLMFSELRAGIGIAIKKMGDDVVAGKDYLKTLITKVERWTEHQVYTTSNDQECRVEVLDSYIKAANKKPGELLGLPTPWPSFNDASQGLQRGELTALMAKRKRGKTTLALAMCAHIKRTVMKPKEKILFVSPEISPKILQRRWAAMDLKLNYAKFRSGQMTKPEENALINYADNIDPDEPGLVFVYGNQLRSRSIADIEIIAHRVEPTMIVIDSFYALGDNRKKLYDRVFEVIEGMSIDLTKRCNVPVVSTGQIKGTTHKKKMNVDSDDAAYAKAIGDYADNVLALFDDIDGSKNTRILTVTESREFEGAGDLGMRIAFDFVQMDFAELEALDMSAILKEEEEGDGGSWKNKGKGGAGGKNGGLPKNARGGASRSSNYRDDAEDDDYKVDF